MTVKIYCVLNLVKNIKKQDMTMNVLTVEEKY